MNVHMYEQRSWETLESQPEDRDHRQLQGGSGHLRQPERQLRSDSDRHVSEALARSRPQNCQRVCLENDAPRDPSSHREIYGVLASTSPN